MHSRNVRRIWSNQELTKVAFTIPSIPPSMNKCYQIIRLPGQPLKIEMSPEVRKWKSDAKECMGKLPVTGDATYFRIDSVFTYNFYYKNGKMKKFDTQNLMKVLIDAVAEKCGVPDEFFKFGSWSSIHSDTVESVSCVLQATPFEISGVVAA